MKRKTLGQIAYESTSWTAKWEKISDQGRRFYSEIAAVVSREVRRRDKAKWERRIRKAESKAFNEPTM